MTLQTHRLALIGFGVVGQAVAEVIRRKHTHLEKTHGLNLQITAVSDLLKGAVYHPEGLDLAALLKAVQSTGNLADYPGHPGLIRGWDSLTTIRQSNANTIIEVSYTDVKTGQPAIDHCRAAFSNSKNVVMSNKGPVALAYQELSALAKENGARWGFESTVMSGTPALRMPQTCLVGNNITEVSGIFNGTTNYILTKMEEGLTYEAALQQAQELGYAEADPTADVEGFDAQGKVVILANVVMGAPLRKEDVPCRGISRLTPADIDRAKAEGKRWKLIGWAKKENGRVTAGVGPEMLPLTDPLAGIMGPTNAITCHTDLIGPVTLVGAGAGGSPTAAGILADIINICC